MTLDNRVGRGLERAGSDRAEIARYLTKIRRKLADSRKDSISLDSRFDIAFEALLQIALLALRANGYRTTSDSGHQQLAIQLLPKSIGIERCRSSVRWTSIGTSVPPACARRISTLRKTK